MAELPIEPFIATLRKSRLFDPAELDRLIARAGAGTGEAFASALIAGNELTHYQADKLLRGRWQGLVLGPYCVLAPLGRGGMGTVVYLARDRRMSGALGDSELVALKLLPDRKVESDPKVLARFRREMELGRRVNHPNVVHTFAAGHLDAVHYLALEFIPGRTLRHVVTQDGPVPPGEAARAFADVAAGLQHVHERGLIHRDLKPANVMIRYDGRAVILDFGLALAPGEALPADPAVAGGRGYVVGTMDYLAPEQATDSTAVGPAADLYGLGCSLYFALTGRVPFPAETTRQKVRRHRLDPPPAIPKVPPELARFVHALLAKDPRKRPGSAASVRDTLLAWATPWRGTGSRNALALADTPGLDAGLWDAAPGDELPLGGPVSSENPFAFVSEVRDDDDPSDVGTATPGASNALGLVLTAVLFGAMALIMLVAVLRRL